MVSEQSRSEAHAKRHTRLHNHFVGTAEGSHPVVFRSNSHMYAQIINDAVGNTLAAAFIMERAAEAEPEKTSDVAAAAYTGILIAKRALEKGIDTVAFDRGGFIYRDEAQTLADATREAGLEF